MDQKPSVGRIVHYKEHNQMECFAAIITSVNDDGSVCLQIFEPMKTIPVMARVMHDSSTDPMAHMVGTWHWPERI